jgi:phosphoglycolate phosphatase-like HAD superfamily hydrolase
MEAFDVRPQDCMFVGDQDSDSKAAEVAGVPFVWAWTFFGWPPTMRGADAR